MAQSTCLKCNSTHFEEVPAEPKHSLIKAMFIQCQNCGTVVGTMTSLDAGVLSRDNKELLVIIQEQLNRIEKKVGDLDDLLRRCLNQR